MAQFRNAKVKVKECNYFGLKHDKVTEKFEGKLTYVGDMCLNSGQPVAVYHAAEPNREKGHKEYVLLQIWEHGGVVSGMDRKEIEKHAKHPAVLCLNCNTVLYSVHRHHFHKCGCENDTFIDGGKEYYAPRVGAMDLSRVQLGYYNVLTKKFRRNDKPQVKGPKPSLHSDKARKPDPEEF